MKISRHFFYVKHSDGNISKNFSTKFRGILGNGLKYLYCENYYNNCNDCEKKSNCTFIKKFKPAEINYLLTTPYAIYSKKIDTNLYKVCLTVINDHIMLKEITDSIEVVRHNGLGINKLNYKVTYINTKVFNIDEKWLLMRENEFFNNYCKLKLLTPVITKKGLNEKALIDSVLNRVKFLSGENLLKYFSSKEKMVVEFLETNIKIRKQFKFSDLSQIKILNISGFVGDILIKLNKMAYILLKIGEIIQIGRFVSFGCGKIHLERII